MGNLGPVCGCFFQTLATWRNLPLTIPPTGPSTKYHNLFLSYRVTQLFSGRRCRSRSAGVPTGDGGQPAAQPERGRGREPAVHQSVPEDKQCAQSVLAAREHRVFLQQQQ